MACVAVTPVASMQKDTLRLTRDFLSLQGEARTAVLPNRLRPLTGCPLRVTIATRPMPYGGEIHHLDAILEQVAS